MERLSGKSFQQQVIVAAQGKYCPLLKKLRQHLKEG